MPRPRRDIVLAVTGRGGVSWNVVPKIEGQRPKRIMGK